MDECSICGKEDKLVPFTQECQGCDILFAKLKGTIKNSQSTGRLDTLRKRLVASFADVGVYVNIEDS